VKIFSPVGRCGKRLQARPVIGWEQLTLIRASEIVKAEPIEYKKGFGGQRRTVDHGYPVPFANADPAGGRYKTHSGGIRLRIPAVQFNRSYP
jgi:hypothetical protein